MSHNSALPSYLPDHPKTPPKSIQGALAELSKVSQTSDSPVRLSSHTESEFTHQSDLQLQDRVKELMDAELRDYTFRSTKLIGEFTKYVRTRKKFDFTIQEMSKAISASVNQGQFARTWGQPSGRREESFYAPFEHLVNSALNKARELLPSSCLGYGKDLTFHAYNAPIHGHSLKPDGIGILSTTEFSSETDRVSWKGVHLFYEAKSQFKEMVYQAGTYTRALQTHQPNRVFVYSFLHVHNKGKIHFSRFDRGGCTYSNSLDIRVAKDQETMAQILLSFLVLPPLCLGVDTSICPNGSWINLYGYRFKIDRVLAYRECVRGHATRVYLVSKPIEGIEEGSKVEIAGEGKTNYNKLESMYALDEFVRDTGGAICVPFKKKPPAPEDAEPVEITQTDSGLSLDKFTSSAQSTGTSRSSSKRKANDDASSHLPKKATTKKQVDPKVVEITPPVVEEKYNHSCDPSTGFDWLKYDVFIVKESFVEDYETADREGYFVKESVSLVRVSNAKPRLHEDLQLAMERYARDGTTRHVAQNRIEVTHIVNNATEMVCEVAPMLPLPITPVTNESANAIPRESGPSPGPLSDVTGDRSKPLQFASIPESNSSKVRVLVAGNSDYDRREQVTGKAFVEDTEVRDSQLGSEGVIAEQKVSTKDAEETTVNEGMASTEENTTMEVDDETDVENESDSDTLVEHPIDTRLNNSLSPQKRTLIRQTMWTIGVPLVEAESPRELFTALRDITLGLLNMHRMGFVHRDISAGNCFLVRSRDLWGIIIKSIEREDGEIVDVEWEAIVKFIGVIADEDRTVRYSISEKRETRSERSGTLPFIARHILEGTNVPHCPVHDLESKIYLAFWVAAYIVRRKTEDRNLRKDMLLDIIKMLRPDSWEELRDCSRPKGTLLAKWAYQPVDEAKTEYFGAFAPFAGILCELAKLGRKWYGKSLEHEDNSTVFTPDEIEQAFAEYLEVYEKYMPTKESWDYLQELKFRERKS